jgi:hypothetical protein
MLPRGTQPALAALSPPAARPASPVLPSVLPADARCVQKHHWRGRFSSPRNAAAIAPFPPPPPSPAAPLHCSLLPHRLSKQDEAPRDALLNSTKGKLGTLAPELRARIAALAANELPSPEAAPSRSDERPSVISQLEAAAFDDGASGDEDGDHALDVPPPARRMSGWVAARLLSESGARAVRVGGVPLVGRALQTQLGVLATPPVGGAVAGAAGAGASSSSSSSSSSSAATSGVSAAAAAAHAHHFAWPRPIMDSSMLTGGGPAVGMGALRLELSLSERLAALAARTEERVS